MIRKKVEGFDESVIKIVEIVIECCGGGDSRRVKYYLEGPEEKATWSSVLGGSATS